MIYSVKDGLAMTKILRGGKITQTPGVFVIARLANEEVKIKCLLTASRSKLNCSMQFKKSRNKI
jgi:hypothetical protein